MQREDGKVSCSALLKSLGGEVGTEPVSLIGSLWYIVHFCHFWADRGRLWDMEAVISDGGLIGTAGRTDPSMSAQYTLPHHENVGPAPLTNPPANSLMLQ